MDFRDSRGAKALMAAVQANNLAIVKCLIHAGSDMANSLRALGRHSDSIAAIESVIAVDPINPLYRVHKGRSLALLR